MKRVPKTAIWLAAGLLAPAAFWAACAAVQGGGGAADVDAGFQIEALSAKPHLVSGGDVLLRVDVPPGTPLTDIQVSLNDSDITASFRPDGSRHALLGLVTGLVGGGNRIAVRADGDDITGLDVTNYPVSGPMISGPHQRPYRCNTETFELVTGGMLGPALDELCSVETRVDYVYRSTDGEFKPLGDPSAPRPADLATVTTLDAHTVPFIVRVETGTVNRAVYESALLHDPAEPTPDPWTRSAGWNGKLVYTHGGGCRGGWYSQGDGTGGVLNAGLLEDGFAVTSSTLNVFGQNCNDLLASETHMMVKERFVEHYGQPIFTIATGSSGGSYQSHQTADNYPGVFDGIIVASSFPDVTSATIFTLADARLLHYYFTEVAPDSFTTEQQRQVSGFGEWGSIPNLSQGAARIDPIFDPTVSAEEQGGEMGLADEAARYDPVANPKGVRATVYDHTVNVYGKDAATGFAARPLDNVGVQYGLAALNAGQITTTQFLDLNARVGGLDLDGNHVAERHVANERASRMALSTGRILFGGAGLATTPVIDYRTYNDHRPNGDIHMIVHQFSTRARLAAANGHADNHVMGVGGRWGFTAEEPDLRTLFRQMDRWLTTLAGDTSDTPQAQKVVRAKPGDLVDHCWDTTVEPRVRIDAPQTFEGSGKCGELYEAFPTPRHVAGAPLVNTIVKCQLKPISTDDYSVSFTADERARLEQIFPDGVCDWTQPDVYATAYRGPWLSFGPSPVNRVE